MGVVPGRDFLQVQRRADELPLSLSFLQAAQAEAPNPEHMLEPSERRFNDGLPPPIPASSHFTPQPLLHRLRVQIFRIRQNVIASLAFPPQRYVCRDLLLRQFPKANGQIAVEEESQLIVAAE